MTKHATAAIGTTNRNGTPAFNAIAAMYAPMPKNAAWPSDI